MGVFFRFWCLVSFSEAPSVHLFPSATAFYIRPAHQGIIAIQRTRAFFCVCKAKLLPLPRSDPPPSTEGGGTKEIYQPPPHMPQRAILAQAPWNTRTPLQTSKRGRPALLLSSQELLPRGVQCPVLEQGVRVCQQQVPCLNNVRCEGRHVLSAAFLAAWVRGCGHLLSLGPPCSLRRAVSIRCRGV